MNESYSTVQEVCTRRFFNFRLAVEGSDPFNAEIKTAVIKASSSVVSIITRTGEELLFIGSGTIIEYDEQHGFATILTSATLIRGYMGATSIPSNLKIEVYLSDGKLYEGHLLLYDFHYNIATIMIKSHSPLPTATLRHIDETLEIDLRRSTLRKHSARFKLHPGELVIALGRDFEGAHGIMASLGVFSTRDSHHDCKEVFMTSCIVTALAVGGPLVNRVGEVIGVNCFILQFNGFIPINIVSKCLEDLKKNRKVARPWIGASIANLYTVDLEKLDKLYQEFPNVSSGVMIERVKGNRNIGSRYITKVHSRTLLSPRHWLKAKAICQYNRKTKKMKSVTSRLNRSSINKSRMRKSQNRKTKKVKSFTSRLNRSNINKSRMRKSQKPPAIAAGLSTGDVVIRCGEHAVHSHLEFVEALWDKEGKPVELVLVRPSIGQRTVTLTVGTCPELPRDEKHLLRQGLSTSTGGFLSIAKILEPSDDAYFVLPSQVNFWA